MDRRLTLKWMLAAAAAPPLARGLQLFAATEPHPYGTDPKLLETYHPGDLWSLTFTPLQRRQATVLCDTIIPADATSPSASAVGVVDFIDEWISAPYPTQRVDRKIVLEGLAWLDAEAARRFTKSLVDLDEQQLHGICDDICYVPKAKPEALEAAKFFARYRDLTAGGFYTTPQGRQDLGYVGNTPLPRFDGPPPEVLRKVGLA
jgi:gluconate 2-dehydrogenase subunit 3-like protein